MPINARTIALLIVVLAAFAFAPGISGPFMLDDAVNLDKIQAWLDGKLSLSAAVLNFRAGPLARPLSMLSFALNAQVSGMQPDAFKLTNLLIHIANALLIASLLHRVLPRDPVLAPRAAWFAGFIAIWWTVLPVHVSSVLYVVQRMAELSTLFTLLGLHAYISAREYMLAGRSGQLLLFVVVPLATVAAALCKENGLLTPAFCLVIELAWFSMADAGRRRGLQVFFAAFLLIPALLGLSWIFLHVDRALPDYQLREFSLGERLLTEPRVLWSYVRVILLPAAPLLGLYRDNYPLSKTLFEPSTTALAMLAWLAVVVAALRWRRSLPALFAGVGVFLAGHAMESTIFPLDIYFEHRNYLPSLGVLLVVVGLFAALLARIKAAAHNDNERSFAALGVVIVLVFAVASDARSFVWQAQETILQQALIGSPDSRRLRVELIVQALQRKNYPDADTHIGVLLASSEPYDRAAGAQWQLIARCDSAAGVRSEDLDRLIANAPPRITLNALAAMEILAQRSLSKRCASLPPYALAQTITPWLQRSDQKPTAEPVWRLRYDLGGLLLASAMLPEAREPLSTAWQDSGHDFAVGAQLMRVLIGMGERKASRQLLQELIAVAKPGVQQEQDALRELRAQLDAAAASAAPLPDADGR